MTARTFSFTLLIIFTGMLNAQVDLLTANYDNFRTSANLNEWNLNANTVNPTQFGQLFALPVDGQVYAQPLYVHGFDIPGRGVLNVLYVATMHNTVYAFDADAIHGTAPSWQVNLGAAVDPLSLIDPAVGPYTDIQHEIGILSTPVIDRAGKTIYVVNETLKGASKAFFLHALDLTNGSEKLNGPVEIQGSVAGTGWGGTSDATTGQLMFDPAQHIQRPGLLLANGSIYVAFGSHGDFVPWHGWIMAYKATDLQQQTAIFNTTPSGAGAAIWQSGRGLAADPNGEIYVSTGNGSYDGAQFRGESILHLTPSLSVADWFTPAEYNALTNEDADFGSNGPVLVPGTNLLVAGGKSGVVVLLDRTNLGHELADNKQVLQIFQAVPTAQFAIFNSALWDRPDGPILYLWGNQDVVRAFHLQSGTFNTSAVAPNKSTNLYPFGGMTISSNGVVPGTGILWATTTAAGVSPPSAVLHAFNAENLSQELWNSSMNSTRDAVGNFTKFANPTVANGKVYMPTDSKQVTVYGLLPVPGITAVLNAASLRSSTVAPGELVAIFGNSIGPENPVGIRLDSQGRVAQQIAGVKVTFDDFAAPLLYASRGQINTVVPFSIAGQTTTLLQVFDPGGKIYSATLAVGAAAPAVFTADSTGSGQGAILNGDLSLNSAANPASRGSYIALYATGTGLLDQTVPDGEVIPDTDPPLAGTPVTVTIAGQPAPISYQGAAPGLVAGVMQINVQIPAGVQPGAVPVVLSVAEIPGLNTVSVAVK